jgi:hypothetical protein
VLYDTIAEVRQQGTQSSGRARGVATSTPMASSWWWLLIASFQLGVGDRELQL